MLLRASGENETYELAAINTADTDSGVPYGAILIKLAELTATSAWTELKTTLAEAASTIGEQQAVDALVVASAFNGITRVADATGIPLDENTEEGTKFMRESIGLDAFAYDAKTARYG